mmetsp:Transcript_105283/g.181580  ORF Transcript_105283/g.181580 Transcript_105283/m.181580 type:complete len:208 (+) Transcript_105283:213-836(+)
MGCFAGSTSAVTGRVAPGDGDRDGERGRGCERARLERELSLASSVRGRPLALCHVSSTVLATARDSGLGSPAKSCIPAAISVTDRERSLWRWTCWATMSMACCVSPDGSNRGHWSSPGRTMDVGLRTGTRGSESWALGSGLEPGFLRYQTSRTLLANLKLSGLSLPSQSRIWDATCCADRFRLRCTVAWALTMSMADWVSPAQSLYR